MRKRFPMSPATTATILPSRARSERPGYARRFVQSVEAVPFADRSPTIAAMELPFEIVGPLPDEWASDLAAYAAALAEHPWGGSSLRRLVIGGINPRSRRGCRLRATSTGKRPKPSAASSPQANRSWPKTACGPPLFPRSTSAPCFCTSRDTRWSRRRWTGGRRLRATSSWTAPTGYGPRGLDRVRRRANPAEHRQSSWLGIQRSGQRLSAGACPRVRDEP